MGNRLIATIVLMCLIAGCNTGKKEPSRLNIVLFGYDSIACYYGNSAAMLDLRYGKLTDPLFMDTVMKTAMAQKPGLIVLKPGEGGGVLGNWEHVDTLFKLNHFEQRVIDTLDEKEQQFFNTNSVIAHLRKQGGERLNLFLPKDEPEQAYDTSENKLLVVLLINENEIYTYNGTLVQNGTKSTYQELKLYLATKKARTDFFVVIKPGKKSSYKSVVDMLDLMTIAKVKNYKLEDITEEEAAIVNRLL